MDRLDPELAQLIDATAHDLQPVSERIRAHPFLAALDAGDVPTRALQALPALRLPLGAGGTGRPTAPARAHRREKGGFDFAVEAWRRPGCRWAPIGSAHCPRRPRARPPLAATLLATLDEDSRRASKCSQQNLSTRVE